MEQKELHANSELKLVVVDDDPDILTMIEKVAGKIDDLSCICFTSPEEAYQWVLVHETDMMIIDYLLPEQNGLALYHRIRQNRNGNRIPSIMITGHSDKRICYNALQAGMDDFLRKPIDITEMQARIRNMARLCRFQKIYKQKERELRASEERFRILAEKSPNIVFLVQKQRILYINEQFTISLGYRPDQVIDKDITDIRCFDERTGSMLRDMLDKGPDLHNDSSEHTLLARDGRILHCILTYRRIHIHGEAALLVIATDIGYRKELEQRLLTAKDYLRGVFDSSPSPIVLVDQEWSIVLANKMALDFFGKPRKDLLFRNLRELLPVEGRMLRSSGKLRSLKKGEMIFFEDFFYTGKERVAVEIRISRIQNPFSENVGEPFYLISWIDISEQKTLQERLEFLAYHDALTGLPNRLLFFDRLSLTLASARRYRLHSAILYLDLDGFKDINDTLSHFIGDQVLKDVAQRIEKSLRESDTVSRVGGDEFVVILPEIKRHRDVRKVCEKLIDTVGQCMQIGGKQYEVGVSIGISIFPEDGKDEEDLMRKSDFAMYRAKEKGRNQYCFFRDYAEAFPDQIKKEDMGFC